MSRTAFVSFFFLNIVDFVSVFEHCLVSLDDKINGKLIVYRRMNEKLVFLFPLEVHIFLICIYVLMTSIFDDCSGILIVQIGILVSSNYYVEHGKN